MSADDSKPQWLTERQVIDELRAMLAASRGEAWALGRFPHATLEEEVEWYRELVLAMRPTRCSFVHFDEDGKGYLVANIGNGPSSEANARLIAAAHNWMPTLLDLADEALRKRGPESVLRGVVRAVAGMAKRKGEG